MLNTPAFLTKKREAMVEGQIKARGIASPRVLEALRRIPRHEFLPEERIAEAYEDYPIPIGFGQTISQPYIVALMTELCLLTGHEKVLEVGAGSGYQTAILASLAKTVYSIECIDYLAAAARNKLAAMGFSNATVISGDGYHGYEREAPYDVIILTAAPKRIPEQLLIQLADPGLLVAPIGDFTQDLVRLKKNFGRIETETITAVRFVPMVHTNGNQNNSNC